PAAKPGWQLALGADRATRRTQDGRGHQASGAGRIAGRLSRRRLGKQFKSTLEDTGAGRCRSGNADRGGDRRRQASAAVARLCRAGCFYPRLVCTTAALVHDRYERGEGIGMQYLLWTGLVEPRWRVSTKADNSYRLKLRC